MKYTCTNYYRYPKYTGIKSLGTPQCHKT